MYNHGGLKIELIDLVKLCKSMRNKLSVLRSISSILCVVSILTFSLIIQGCEKDEFNIPTNYGLCNVEKIEANQLPEGVKPLEVKSKEEFNTIVSQLNSLEVNTTGNNLNEIVSIKDGELVIGITVRKFEKLNSGRLKSGTIESGIIDVNAPNVGGLSVLVHLAYSNIGGEITVTSTESSNSLFLAWAQTAGTASWGNSNKRINFSVRGDVIGYILFEASFFEVSRTNYKIDGYANLNV